LLALLESNEADRSVGYFSQNAKRLGRSLRPEQGEQGDRK